MPHINLNHVFDDTARATKPQPLTFQLGDAEYNTRPIDEVTITRVFASGEHTDAENVTFARELIDGTPPPEFDAILDPANRFAVNAGATLFTVFMAAVVAHFDEVSGISARARESRRLIREQLEAGRN